MRLFTSPSITSTCAGTITVQCFDSCDRQRKRCNPAMTVNIDLLILDIKFIIEGTKVFQSFQSCISVSVLSREIQRSMYKKHATPSTNVIRRGILS